jgi:hypothetical protein
MSSRTLTLTVLALVLVVLAVVAPSAQAQSVGECQAHPLCSVQNSDTTTRVELFTPPALNSTVTPLGAQQYIGGCCPNNDASQCPAVGGYTSVHCGFPMCSSGFLTCIYS